MKNNSRCHKTLTVAHTAAVVSGVGVLLGSGTDKVFGVPVTDGDADVAVAYKVKDCVLEFAKQATDDFVVGEKVYWDAVNSRMEKAASGLSYVGHCVEDTASGSETVYVSIHGEPVEAEA